MGEKCDACGTKEPGGDGYWCGLYMDYPGNSMSPGYKLCNYCTQTLESAFDHGKMEVAMKALEEAGA